MSRDFFRAVRARRPSWLPVIGLLCLLAPAQQAAATSSSATVSLQEAFPGAPIVFDTRSNTSTPATAALGGASGSAVSDLGTGKVGAKIILAPGTPTGFYGAFASWDDFWTSGSSGVVPVAATITLRGSIDFSSNPNWEIQFEYLVGNNTVLSFLAFADGSVPEFLANANGVDITSSIVFTPNPLNPLLTDFSLSATPIVNVSASGFTDRMDLVVRADAASGPLTVDAFQTFSVSLVSLDPSVTFTGEGGRTIASVPEPGTFALVLGGLGLLGCWRRRASQ